MPEFRDDLMILAGEPSGDAYGAAIVKCLRDKRPQLRCSAMGGQALAAVGADMVHDNAGMAVMGLLPVLARLPEFMAVGRKMAKEVEQRLPRVVLTIDYPGFNLRLVRRCAALRAKGVRFIHVVAPQVWAWKPRRAKSVAHTVDRLLCFFPFEPPLFARFGCQADFVGHPLLDLIPSTRTLTAGIDQQFGWNPEHKLLLLAPGSREREIATLLPYFDRVARALTTRVAGPVQIAVATVPDRSPDFYRQFTSFPLIPGRYHQLCARAHAGLIASGTATLEAGLIGLPHVIAYRMDSMTAALARKLVITKFAGLPNIVCGRRIVPEVLQDQLSKPRLLAHLLRLWQGPHRDACFVGLQDMHQRLGAGGALDRIAGILDREIAGQ